MTKIVTDWDLTPLLSDDHDSHVDEQIEEAKSSYRDFTDKWINRDDYLTNPEVLKEALEDYNNLLQNYDGVGSAGYYFWLRSQQNQLDPFIKSQTNRINNIEVKLGNDIEFFTNRLCRVPQDTQKKILGFKDLRIYKHFLEKLFESAKYTLSEAEEKILNLMEQVSYSNWVKMVSEFISREEKEILTESGEKATKTFSDFISLINSTQKVVRDDSARALNEVLEKYADVAEHELNSVLLDKKINDELRGVYRPDVVRHQQDDVDTETIDVLLDTVSSRFDISARYYKLKSSIMGVSKLAYHERNVLLGNISKEYPFVETVEIIGSTFKSLDGDFADIFYSMVHGGRIDVYPHKGKTNGAFCVYRRVNDPVYILLNHTNKLKDVITLGHEMGHAINDVLVSRVQNGLNYGTPISTAEVASTFMEDFIFEKITESYDDKDKLHLLMEKLNDDTSSIFRQVACYKFEQELHSLYREKNYLTKHDIGLLFQKHMNSYMGDAVEMSPGSQNWWIYWSHIRHFFYVYSYASGQLISKSLQNMVRKDRTQVEKVKKFLSAGLSESPKRLFMNMGIDISDKKFWIAGLNEVERALTQAEKLASQLQLSN